MANNGTQFRKDTGADVKYVKGVGEARARLLAKMRIRTVLDLMEHFPRYHISRQVNPSAEDLAPGTRVALTAMISWFDVRVTRRNKRILSVGISEGRYPIVCSWFSYPKPYETMFQPGKTIWVSGVLSDYNGQLQLVHPDFELVDDKEDDDFWQSRSHLPIYPLTADLKQMTMRRVIYQAFAFYADCIKENLPENLLAKYAFLPRKIALQKMHFTNHPEELEQIRKRFVYEEFFYSQLLWARHKHYHQEQVAGICHENRKDLTRRLYQNLPFQLTGAQKKVLREIFADMTSQTQMSRLLQGDVGSGKTIVTLLAMLLSVENGYQAALMAPTEILADQHYANICSLLGDIPVQVALLKGGNYKGKAQVRDDIAQGRVDIIIGTHALIQDDMAFYRLGFVAVDEQHRFGVKQRASLAKKDHHPDILYLSATPIPRSLSMTVYGDLQVSILDELPPNRRPVQTFIRPIAKIGIVYAEVRKELEAGRQAYVVCPLIEESDKTDLLDAQTLHQHLSRKIYPDFKCELLHGRMKSAQKDEIMLRFKAGEVKVLVSTTVIEVGVDVPNATVMIVEHAERFGLAQLHQLRGRVGRGANQSRCYLIEHFPISAIAYERLLTLAGSTDGFVIAEKDLELRGPGEFFGTEQSGMPDFRFANLIKDQDILSLARADAFEIVQNDPTLEHPEHALIKVEYQSKYHDKEQLILY